MLEIIPPITHIETIAEGRGIHILSRSRQHYGPGIWKKKKGIAMLRIGDGPPVRVELHWYEAHGIGKVKMKVTR